jgi:hypothetical protein
VWVISFFSSLAGIGVNMVFIDILEASKFAISFWLMLGISLSSIKLLKNE